MGREEEENLRGKMNLGKWQLVRGEVWNEWKSTRLVFHWGTTAADCGTKILGSKVGGVCPPVGGGKGPGFHCWSQSQGDFPADAVTHIDTFLGDS